MSMTRYSILANEHPRSTALRSMYTGRIKPIMTWGCGLCNRGNHRTRQPLEQLEYQSLRRITGAYNGSSHRKLGFITNVEPIQTVLDHASISWAARNTRAWDTLVIAALGKGDFSDGSNPHYQGQTSIEEAFHKPPGRA